MSESSPMISPAPTSAMMRSSPRSDVTVILTRPCSSDSSHRRGRRPQRALPQLWRRARTRRQTIASSSAVAGGKESYSTAVLCACPSPYPTMCRPYSWAAARYTAASGQPPRESNCGVVHRSDDRFARIGRDRFIACGMIRALVSRFGRRPHPSHRRKNRVPGQRQQELAGDSLLAGAGGGDL